jgi:hypothetical protein
MSNKTITFTLTNGDGTINVAEDSILYMSENTDTVTGGYILSVDEKADREIIYIVDEDIATMEAAASKMFSVNLANEGQVMSLNADRCSVIDNLSGDRLDLNVTGANQSPALGQLLDTSRLLANSFPSVGVEVGDTLVKISTNDNFTITSVGTAALFFEPSNILFGIGESYKIVRGGLENSKIYYRGLGIDFDVKEVTESLSEITNLINTL